MKSHAVAVNAVATPYCSGPCCVSHDLDVTYNVMRGRQPCILHSLIARHQGRRYSDSAKLTCRDHLDAFTCVVFELFVKKQMNLEITKKRSQAFASRSESS